MDHSIMQTVILAVVVGIGCYALSRRLRMPAILFYLVAGMVMGPMGLNVLHVRELGDGLFILVEIGVAIILLEGGMSLNTRGFMKAPAAIGRLLLLTIPLTALGASLFARYILHMSWDLAVVFGTLIVVTGPTVIGPLLKSINLDQRVEVLLHWESIWGDVAGVVLSALALKFVAIAGLPEVHQVAGIFLLSVVTGTFVGLAGGVILNSVVFPWLREIREKHLMGIVTLAGALGIFYGSQVIMSSSGPLAVAVAGFYLSYRRDRALHSIRHFKDQLSVIFISTLFVLLSGFINPLEIRDAWPGILGTALGLGLLVRPAAVFTALSRSTATWRERLYVSAIGPRGILALAAAFYASLVVTGRDQEMTLLLITTFVIIFVSGAFTTVLGRPLARLLNVLQSPAKTGLLIVGANPFSLKLAEYASQYVPFSFLDTNKEQCLFFEERNITSFCVDVLDDEVYEDARGEGFDRLIALTPDDSLNQLICQKAGLHFGEDKVFAVQGRPRNKNIETKPPYEVNYAFARDFFLTKSIQALENGMARLEERVLDRSEEERVIPLFRLPDEGGLEISRAESSPEGRYLTLVIDHPDEGEA